MSSITDLQFSIAASGPPNGDATPTAGMDVGMGVPVEPPPLIQQPVNIVRSSRTPSDPASVRWTNGFTYLPNAIGDLEISDDCGPDTVNVPVDEDYGTVNWHPYLLRASFRCSAFGWSENNYAARAKALLDAATPKMVEYELWNGALSGAASYGNLYLTYTGGTADIYTASSIQEAVGICEQYISQMNYGGRGMIHLPPFLSPYLQLVARREGNLLLTNRDTIVVPGAGYGKYPVNPGDKPPQPASPFVVVGTSITDVRLTDIITFPDDPSQSLDRRTNTVVVKAERYACASWDGVTFCHVDLTMT